MTAPLAQRLKTVSDALYAEGLHVFAEVTKEAAAEIDRLAGVANGHVLAHHVAVSTIATLTAERDDAMRVLAERMHEAGATIGRLEQYNRDIARALAEWQERARDGEETIAKLRAVAEAAKSMHAEGCAPSCAAWKRLGSELAALAALDERKETENG